MDSTTTTQAAPEPRSMDAGRGVNWWTDSWTLFMKNPGMCIVLGLVLLVVCVVLNFVPVLGGLALALLMPAFMGSWLLAARKLESGGTLEVGDAFLAFKDQLTPLLVLGALSLAATAVIFIVLTVFGMGAAFGLGFGGGMHGGMGAMAAMGAGLFGVLVAMALFVPVSMAFWFAPALVVFDGMAPVEAIKASFAACLRNVMPFLVYGVLGLVASIVASIPFGLGWLVLLPLSGLSIYLSYRDIFNR
jgi:uncharacterized membrane protein